MVPSVTHTVMKRSVRKAALCVALLFLLCGLMPCSSALADTLISSVTVAFDALEAGDSVSAFLATVSTSTETVDESTLTVTVSPSGETFKAGQTYTFNLAGKPAEGYYFPSGSSLKLQVYFGESRVSSSNNAAATEESFIYTFTYTVPSAAVTPVPEQAKPTVTKHPADETVEQGGSCSFIARADVETHIDWYFTDTDGKEYDCTAAKEALTGLRLKGEKDEKIILSQIPIEMDGWKIFCVFSNDKSESTETNTASIHVTKAKPILTKSPSGETVDIGGRCAFIARADGADTITWYLTDGTDTVLADSAAKQFDGLSVSGADEEKLVLSNIPAALNGWSVYAEFENETGKTRSEQATVTVNIPGTATPEITQPPVPTVTPAPPVTPDPATETPDVSEAPAGDHTHSFGDEWFYDENEHYHLCDCGEKSDVAGHQWTVQTVKEATATSQGEQVAVCSVCGCTVTTAIAATEEDNTKSLLILLLVVCLVLLAGVIGFLAVYIYKEVRRKQRLERRHRIREEAEGLAGGVEDTDIDLGL